MAVDPAAKALGKKHDAGERRAETAKKAAATRWEAKR